MSGIEPLGRAALVGFVASSDLDRSRAFYEGVLGFEVVGQDGFACVLRAGETTVRITLVPEVLAAPYTVLGWEVDDLAEAVDALAARGVSFLRFEGMDAGRPGHLDRTGRRPGFVVPRSRRSRALLDPAPSLTKS